MSRSRALLFFLACSFTGNVWCGDLSVVSNPTATPDPKWEPPFFSFFDGKILFDLEERVRGEFRENNRDFNSAVRDNNDGNWVIQRFRFGLALNPARWIKLYAQTQDAREAYSPRPNIPGVSGAEGDDEFDLRMAFVALGDLKRFPLLLTVGRQGITYGDARLVADSRWGNFGRTFDSVRLRYEVERFWLEAFYARPVQIIRHVFDTHDPADNLAGVYFSTSFLPVQTSDAYVFYRDKKGNQPDLSPTNTTDPQGSWNGPAAHYVTLGLRVKSNPTALNGWDYGGEIAYENGVLFASTESSTRYDLQTFALNVAGGYTVKKLAWQPRLGLEYDFGTGDHDPTDGSSESFQNMFPSNHERFGFMDEFSWRNIHDLRVQLTAQPVKKLGLELDYHAFFLADTHDYWYRSNGISTLRTTTPDGQDVRTIGARNFAGQEIDFTATYVLNRNATAQVGYSHFFAGAYLNDTGPASDADFYYVMATLSY